MSTIGIHSSSRVVDRSGAMAPDGAAFEPGAADEPAARPSASIVAAEPGAIVDSSTSNRSTANRTGAYGSSGGADPPATIAPEPPGADPTGRSDADGTAPDGADEGVPDEAAASLTGVTVYSPGIAVPANVTLVLPGDAGTRSLDCPSGVVTVSLLAPAGIVSSTGSPGATASAGAVPAPSSSPVRFASRIGNATCSGRSDSRGSNASTAVGRPALVPEYRRGEPLGPGMIVRAQSGSTSWAADAMWVVERST